MIFLRQLKQALSRIGAAVEHHVLTSVAQFAGYVLVHRELAGIDDPHVHASFDRAIKKDRVHGAAHWLVAAKRKRNVRHASRDMGERQALANERGGIDESAGV